ncbi:MAG: phytanoyl-CoA dioxygenase family protein [Sneathiellaceae bacterium]
MNGAPVRSITEDEVRTFESDGVVLLKGLFDAEWVAFMQGAAEKSLADPGELHFEFAAERKDPGRFFFETFSWLHNADCERFVRHSPAAAIAGALMRASKVNIFFDQWLIKEPGTPTETPWHHDLPFWPVDGSQVCTLWLALDPVTVQTGAVEYVTGSHRWGKRFRARSFSGVNRYDEDLPEVPDIEALRDGLSFVQHELQPGDCTVHHGLTVHGSPGNFSTGMRRRAHVTRWAGDDAFYHPRPNIQKIPRDPGIPAGAPLDCDLWPVIWRA